MGKNVSEYINDYYGTRIVGTDGGLGCLKDFHFDDRSWKIHSAVVETGIFLPGKRFLLSLGHFKKISSAGNEISTDVTRDELSLQPWLLLNPPSMLPYEKGHPGNLHDAIGSRHSRSTRSLHKRWIETNDGKRGIIGGIMVDREEWRITDIVAVNGSWLSRRQILVSTENIRRIGSIGSPLRSRRLRFANY